MSLPDNQLSTTPAISSFIGGKSFPVTGQLDYEYGPIALQEASRGINYQLWTSRLENGIVYIKAPTVPEYAFLTLPDVTEMSFSFDHNANITFVYVQAGSVFMYWFDSSVGGYVTTPYGSDIVSPRLTHDDKRTLQSSVSDVIFAYVHIDTRDGLGEPLTASLRYRQQRERYGVERIIATNVTDGLVKIGMMRNLRVGFQLKQQSGAVIVNTP